MPRTSSSSAVPTMLAATPVQNAMPADHRPTRTQNAIARPPVEDVDAECRDHERDREVHHHHVDRMADQGDRRADVEPQHLEQDRARRSVPGSSSDFAMARPPCAGRMLTRRIIASCARRSDLGAASAALAGCTGPLSTLDPSGPAAASIATLWWVMLAGVGRALRAGHGPLRAGRSCGRAGASRVSPHALDRARRARACRPSCCCRWSPTGWSPASACCRCRAAAPPRDRGHGASNGRWTFRYPDHGGVTTEGVLHLPAGTPVDIVVTSRDVIHAFWIPRLAGKIDAVPGQRQRAAHPGRHAGPLRGALRRVLRHRPRRHALRRHRASGRGFRRRAGASRRSREANKMSAPARAAAAGRPGAAAAPRTRRDLGHRAGACSASPRSTIPSSACASWSRRSSSSLIAGVLGMLTRVQLATPDAALHGRGDLQPGLHDARLDDAVPVRHPDARGHRGLPDAEDPRHARLRLPAADRLRLLVLPVRRLDPDRVAGRSGSRPTAAGSCTRR